MKLIPPDDSARSRARARRSSGTVIDFDGKRLSLARRMKRLPRTELAKRAGLTPGSITQYERGDVRPTRAALAALALGLGFPEDFFVGGRPIPTVPTGSAHFRSLRSTPAISRDQARAFAELALVLVDTLEEYADLPALDLPVIPVDSTAPRNEVEYAAAETRARWQVGSGPIPHMIRLLESHGAVALRLPTTLDTRVDAFSTDAGSRPLVLLSPAKADKARSRFDAAHELGHLVMHHDQEPGVKPIEDAAQAFAAEFLAPTAELEPELPRRIDWEALQAAKKKWGVSVKSLVFRSRQLGIWSDATSRRANQILAGWGYPEPGSIGAPESPYVIGAAWDLIIESGITEENIRASSRLTPDQLSEIVQAGREDRPRLTVVTER